jgi:hypothetical protein
MKWACGVSGARAGAPVSLELVGGAVAAAVGVILATFDRPRRAGAKMAHAGRSSVWAADPRVLRAAPPQHNCACDCAVGCATDSFLAAIRAAAGAVFRGFLAFGAGAGRKRLRILSSRSRVAKSLISRPTAHLDCTHRRARRRRARWPSSIYRFAAAPAGGGERRPCTALSSHHAVAAGGNPHWARLILDQLAVRPEALRMAYGEAKRRTPCPEEDLQRRHALAASTYSVDQIGSAASFRHPAGSVTSTRHWQLYARGWPRPT